MVRTRVRFRDLRSGRRRPMGPDSESARRPEFRDLARGPHLAGSICTWISRTSASSKPHCSAQWSHGPHSPRNYAKAFPRIHARTRPSFSSSKESFPGARTSPACPTTFAKRSISISTARRRPTLDLGIRRHRVLGGSRQREGLPSRGLERATSPKKSGDDNQPRIRRAAA